MGIDEIKAAIKTLSVEERRKVALFILDLERTHLQDTLGPQIAEDLESVLKVIQETVEKIKRHVKNNL
jgi:hypothetical protein